ncbi:hypothetical protein EXIGLDRAFT_729031 [Exidia glandulosa HHB12029]|uniref:Uncharacterized protein n=1 Tax=Exidia glandulosa HHB12029 TaxID=1314781 RepID=A0A165CSP5_EXIGL|nr:hypothetical protein EXIGLDRAFT_729031 [Exidia glandulosa HHB12029]
MSTSLRVWEEQHLLPFDNIFKRTAKKGTWTVNDVQIEFLRENPTFYLLGSPPFVSQRPAEGEMLKQLVPEIQLLLADTLRDWREQLDNASQARMVRFWLEEMVKREMRFGWRHPGPETAEIAREFLEDAEDDVELKVKFEKAGLRLENDEYRAA